METLVVDESGSRTAKYKHMTKEIYKTIWEFSPQISSKSCYRKLMRLTGELMEAYDLEGRLICDPFGPTRERSLSLPVGQLHKELKDRVCLVTGGMGCVGSVLVDELLKLNVKKIIILDKKTPAKISTSDQIVSVVCDIRNGQKVREVFSRYQPEFVFHTAAERDPGIAEMHVEDAVSTNVLGTLSIVKACEATPQVKQMIFSSTGKASRYFTEDIYAGSKKMCEFILDTYARRSSVKYGIVRFTHILDNSLMNLDLKNKSENEDFVSIHSPGKYVTAQNAKEAAHLMLNALCHASEKQCNLFLVRHLEWPVESLEMALYHIKQSGRMIPIIFRGNPKGYAEKAFRGQFDWANSGDLNSLINVYEAKYRRLNASEDIIISQIVSTNEFTLVRVLDRIEKTKGELETRAALVEGLQDLVRESLKTVERKRTLDIIRWGIDPKFLKLENSRISDFDPIILLLMESLEDRSNFKDVERLTYQIAQ